MLCTAYGHPPWYTAGRAIGATRVELLTSPDALRRARAEFLERTRGGIGVPSGSRRFSPRRFPAPVHDRWPESVTTGRGEEGWIAADPGSA